MNAKRLLAVVLSLVVLIGLVPVAGLLTGAAATDPTVTEVAFPAANETFVMTYYYTTWASDVTNKENAQYVLTFDYFLDGPAVKATLNSDLTSTDLKWPRGGQVYVEGDKVIQPGYGKFSITVTSESKHFFATFKATAQSTLYIWNAQYVIAGQQTVAYTPGTVGDEGTGGAAGTTASVSANKTLSTYPWMQTVAKATFTNPPDTETDEKKRVIKWTLGDWRGKNTLGDGFDAAVTTGYVNFTVSFDYYLASGNVTMDGNATSPTDLAWTSGFQNYVSGDQALKSGKNSFSVVMKSSYNAQYNNIFQCRPTFFADGPAELYVWNVKVTVGETTAWKNMTGSGGDGWVWAAATQHTAVDTSKIVAEYDFLLNPPANAAVTEIVFPSPAGETTSQWGPSNSNGFYFNGASEQTAYTVSFDYYLPKAVTSLTMGSVSGFMVTVKDSMALKTTAGVHHFEVTTYANPEKYSNGQFVPYIEAPVGTEMYLWNWSVKQYNAELAPSAGSWTHDTVGTAGKNLIEYPWSTAVPNYPKGVEVYKLGFGSRDFESTAIWDKPEGQLTAGKEYVLSFNYSLTSGDPVRIFDAASWGANTAGAVSFSANDYPTVGNNAFSMTFTAAGNGKFIPAFQQPANWNSGDMYIWNFSLV